MGEEVTIIDASEDSHFNSKEGTQSLIPDGSNIRISHEMVIPTEGDIIEGSKGPTRNISSLDASENPCTSPHFIDDGGVMVEELTLRNLNGQNVAVVGSSNSRDRDQPRTEPWHHLYQLAGQPRSNPRSTSLLRDNMEDVGYSSFSEFLRKKSLPHSPSNDDHNEVSLMSDRNTLSPGGGGIRTKMFSSSGFSEFFLKNTLKGKGVICRGPAHIRQQIKKPNIDANVVSSNVSVDFGSKAALTCQHGSDSSESLHDGINLREWMRDGSRRVNKADSLDIFRQIVEMVDISHSQGVEFLGLRPSCFKISPVKQVKYIGLSVDSEISERLIGKRPLEKALASNNLCPKKQKTAENMSFKRRFPQFPCRSGLERQTMSCFNEHDSHRTDMGRQESTSLSVQLEEKWYTSAEELSGRNSTISSNIYCLGVLLFELISCFDSEEAHAAAMADLQHRILPPAFLSENPKEAGFLLWLLHPESSSRPTARDLLQSDLISRLPEVSGDESLSSIAEDDVETDLLLHFLVSLKDHKEKHGTKLAEDIKFLEEDIEEIEKRSLNTPIVSNTEDLKLMRNIDQLESAYFSVRGKLQLPETDSTARQDNDLLENRRNLQPIHSNNEEKQKPTDRVGSFFEGLCKYARFDKFEVRGGLRNCDFVNSANVICSLSFDRDEDYFAAAGVSKKIKIYDFHELLNDSVDIHYPMIEMQNKSKLSCVCWNSYIRNYLASTDYDGVVKLWDAGSGQGFSEYEEHQKRAWSVDFSRVDPRKFASGSDDCSVKIWSINEKNSLGTIRNIANVCCVQFSSHSTNFLAFGSADYKTYCYDLRNPKIPWCILAGHDKAVSYVKFLDSETIVTASTDNTLKLWDLNRTTSTGVSTSACSLTISGHTNEKNFVGLSVADGFIACGSETNEVYAYCRSLPMPITSHKFGSIDVISGKEIDDNNNQEFVSSVCWKGKSNMLVAANSSGCIKVLEMV